MSGPVERGRENETEAAEAASVQRTADSGGGHRDLALGIAILAICSVLWYMTTQFRLAPPTLSQNVPASFFPRLLISAVVILSLILIGTGWRKAQPPAGVPPRRVLLTGGVCLALLFGIAWVGVFPAIAAIAVTIPLLWGERRLTLLAVYAGGLCLFIWIVFSLVMGVGFPSGALFS